VRSIRQGTTATGLVVLLLIFVVLLALIVVFFQQILVGLAAADRQPNQVLYLVLVVFPLALLGVIVFQLVRLARERAARRPGARLKGRLLLFFGFVALLSAVPQALLSISFISSTLSFWLRAGIGESLAAGLDLSLAYYHGLVENLARFNSSPLVPVILQDLGRNPERLWKNVQTAKPPIPRCTSSRCSRTMGRSCCSGGGGRGACGKPRPPRATCPRRIAATSACCGTRPCRRSGGVP